MPAFTVRPDPEHDAVEIEFDGCTLVIQPGDFCAGLVGRHLALYPASVLLDPADELPPPEWEVVIPPPVLRVTPFTPRLEP